MNKDIKTQTERAGTPSFSTVVEILAPSALRVYDSAAQAVDALLRNEAPASELRMRCQDGRILVQHEHCGRQMQSSGFEALLGTLAGGLLS